MSRALGAAYFLLRRNITTPAPINTSDAATTPMTIPVELLSDFFVVVTFTFVSVVVSGRASAV